MDEDQRSDREILLEVENSLRFLTSVVSDVLKALDRNPLARNLLGRSRR